MQFELRYPKYLKFTNIRTMCEAFSKPLVTKTLLGEVHKLLDMYLKVTSRMSSIRDFRPQTTHELPKKQESRKQEAGPPGQLPTVDALSQIDYGHTSHFKDCKEVCLCQQTTQRAFWKL